MKGYITEANNTSITSRAARRVITIHTDGACLGNPGAGGWGVILQAWDADRAGKWKGLSGGEPQTTNNRMELRAAIEGLKALKRSHHPVVVISDSKYVVDGMSSWVARWKSTGWKASNRKPVKNVDLWKELDTLAYWQGGVSWRWTKGHSGDPMNERADTLASIEALKQKTRSGGIV
jgi:ribonuclease HI